MQKMARVYRIGDAKKTADGLGYERSVIVLSCLYLSAFMISFLIHGYRLQSRRAVCDARVPLRPPLPLQATAV